MKTSEAYRIVIIGAGNVATHISRHFISRGHRILCIYSRSMESASALARELDCPALTDPDDLPEQADFYILCIPDAAIPGVISGFRGRKGIWLHTAGAVDMEVFQGLLGSYGVLYPLQTLSKHLPLSLDQTPMLVEGSTVAVRDAITRLAGSLSNHIQVVDSHSRRILHLAAVFANNFTNHMVHIGQEILSEQHLDKQLLDAILKETLRKILATGAGEAQTGPAIRKDAETMRKHRDLLNQHPEWEKLYTFISRDIGRIRDK